MTDAELVEKKLARLGEPRSNRDLFALLERNGWLAADLTRSLSAMAWEKRSSPSAFRSCAN